MTNLECILAENKYGKYCVPRSSRHRPASQTILVGEVWEQETIDFMLAHGEPGDIVHAGTYFGDMLPALSTGLQTVWGFEPNPENYRCSHITTEISMLENVYVFNVGLGAADTRLSFQTHDSLGRALGGGSRLYPFPPSIMVDIVSLDNFLPFPPISIIHLDIEGFETEALDGAYQTIRRCEPILILETVPPSWWMDINLYPLGYKEICRVDSNTVFAVR